MIPKYHDIKDLLKKGLTIEAQEKIMELREAALDLEEENRTLKDRIRELEEELRIKGNMVYEKPSYWLVDDNDKDGPFCQKCYDSGKKVIRLQGGNNDRWACYECQSTYYGPNYKAPKPIIVDKGNPIDAIKRW